MTEQTHRDTPAGPGPNTLICVARYDGLRRSLPEEAPPTGTGKHLQLTVTLREVPATEAPVAARVPASFDFVAAYGEETADIRLVDGNLYRQLRYVYGEAITPQTALLSPANGFFFGVYDTREAAHASILERTQNIILIDGECWERTSEPVIERLDTRLLVRSSHHSYRPGTTFALAREAEAVAAAGAPLLPENRNRPRNFPGIDILIPEAFSEPTPDQHERARREAEQQIREAFALTTEPTPARMREAAILLLEAADKSDACLSPR